MNESKSIFKSKTLAVNLVAMLASLYPPVGAVVATHPQEAVLALGVANLLLRLVTKKKVSLFPES
jgi:hypothetical protein